MIPLRDNLPGGGPPPAALGLSAAVIATGLLLPGGNVWVALICGFGMYLFAPSVVRSIGELGCLLTALLGGVIAAAVALLSSDPVGSWSAPAAVAAVAIAHLLLNRRSRIIGLVPIPATARIVSVPTISVVIGWAFIAAALAV